MQQCYEATQVPEGAAAARKAVQGSSSSDRAVAEHGSTKACVACTSALPK